MPTALTAAALRDELHATHHMGRLQRMLELGRAARTDPAALALIDELSRAEVFERRLALLSQYTLRDGRRVLPFTQDPARSIRSLAFLLVPDVCDDAQSLEALQVAYTLRRDRPLVAALSARNRRTVVDRYLDWLATQPGLHDFADLVPMASLEGVRVHLSRALERPSTVFWARMARYAPDALGMVLCDRLRAGPGEPDAVTRQLIDAHVAQIVARAPDRGAELLDLLFYRRIVLHAALLIPLGAVRPHAALALLERHDLRVTGAPFAPRARELSADQLARLVRRSPTLLGSAQKLAREVSPEQLAAVVDAWCDVMTEHPAWGYALLERVRDAGLRERAWERWSVAARTPEGIIGMALVAGLPNDLREREARRHLDEVVALRTRPAERMPFARFLPWDEAEAALRSYVGHPEGSTRGAALTQMLAIPGFRTAETTLVDRALALVTARKNEQDPVRATMLQALLAWPRGVFRTEHTTVIGQILRDALDAGDLSHGTAASAEALLVRTFRLDPAWGAQWLGTLIKERGVLYDGRLGLHLSDDDVRAAAPHLLAVASAWSARERVYQLVQLAESLGARVHLVPGLMDLLDRARREQPIAYVAVAITTLIARIDRARFESTLGDTLRLWFDRGWTNEVLQFAQWKEKPGRRLAPAHPDLVAALEKIARGHGTNAQVSTGVTLLRLRAPARFDAIIAALLASDESYVALPVVHWHLHKRRQDLLTPFLVPHVIRGRFATGKTAWLLPFTHGFYRWTPPQNVAFSHALDAIVRDPERDTPTVWRCLTIFANLDSAPMDPLAALAGDTRPAVQERAIRVMARCDRGQCVPTLLRCLEDARARIAIYGLRKAVKDMPPARALGILVGVAMNKVTVAKEVVRLTGELRAEAAYDRLLALDAIQLHRDVRIALLRALWDHMDRPATWAVFERAVTGSDWVMASRLGDIPANRLTRESDRRLSTLLGRLLDRPEPEARIDLLQRAAMLAVSDPERTFLTACSGRLRSPHDDEVRAATMAILHRSTEQDMERLPGLLTVAAGDPRCLHVAIGALLSVPVKGRRVWTQAARAAMVVTARDPRWVVLRVKCAAAAMEGDEFAALVAEIGEAGGLSSDAMEACRSALDPMPAEQWLPLVDRLRASTSEDARRVAVWALIRDAGPGRGWSPERLERLRALQMDPSARVAGAAAGVFPPREMLG